MPNQRIEEFFLQIISFHGFSSTHMTGHSCLIPDGKSYSNKQGLLLWVYYSNEGIVTKLEHLISPLRKYRLFGMLKISEEQYQNEYLPRIVSYYNQLIKLDFKNFGGGFKINGSKIFNLSIGISAFHNNPDLLKEFESILINNPLTQFAEDNGYFVCKEKDKYLADSYI